MLRLTLGCQMKHQRYELPLALMRARTDVIINVRQCTAVISVVIGNDEAAAPPPRSRLAHLSKSY